MDIAKRETTGLDQKKLRALLELKKGDRITRETLVDLLGGDPDSRTYGLKVLALTQWLEREFEDDGRPIMIAQDHGALCLLTSEEAVEVGQERRKLAVASLIRNHERMVKCIDREELSPEMARVHQEELDIGSRLTEAICRVFHRKNAVRRIEVGAANGNGTKEA